MGTLAQLKTRVLESLPAGSVSVRQIGQHVDDAIARYDRERFFFNIGSAVSATVTGQAAVAAPARLKAEDLVQIQQGGSVYPLVKLTRDGPDERRLASPTTGQPQAYAWGGGETLELWPTPNAVFSLVATGVYAQPPLANDAASNAWTTEGGELIAACARKTLFRDVLSDGGRALAALQAEEEALLSLRSQTVRRLNTGVMRAFP